MRCENPLPGSFSQQASQIVSANPSSYLTGAGSHLSARWRRLEAGLSPVSVVTGAYAEHVKSAVRDLPVEIVHNEAWRSGQASSIRAGISFPSAGPLAQILRI